jgi:hypothetical protein
MSSDFARARLLRERGRHEEAVATLFSHLAHHPEDPDAFIELAINRTEIAGQMNLALADIRTACGLRPGNAFLLSIQSRILSKLNRSEESLEMARAALTEDPDLAHGWISKGLALTGLGRWKGVEDCALTALRLNANDPVASNLLVEALRLQNRLDDSDSVARKGLSHDPENAFLFTNTGFTALQRGDIRLSEAQFLESLRINPQSKHAKNGLKEAYRARSTFYRLFLRLQFFKFRIPYPHHAGMWTTAAIGIGLFAMVNILTRTPPQYLPYVGFILVGLPILAFFALLFFAILSSGIANFLLLKDPVARASLDPSEKIEGAVTGSLFFGGSTALIAGGLLNSPPCAVAGGAMIAAAVPASLAFANCSLKGRIVFGAFLVAIILRGGFMTVDASRHTYQNLIDGNFALSAFVMSLFVIISALLRREPSYRPASPQ